MLESFKRNIKPVQKIIFTGGMAALSAFNAAWVFKKSSDHIVKENIAGSLYATSVATTFAASAYMSVKELLDTLLNSNNGNESEVKSKTDILIENVKHFSRKYFNPVLFSVSALTALGASFHLLNFSNDKDLDNNDRLVLLSLLISSVDASAKFINIADRLDIAPTKEQYQQALQEETSKKKEDVTVKPNPTIETGLRHRKNVSEQNKGQIQEL